MSVESESICSPLISNQVFLDDDIGHKLERFNSNDSVTNIDSAFSAFELRRNKIYSFDHAPLPQVALYYKDDGTRNLQTNFIPNANGPKVSSDELVNNVPMAAMKDQEIPEDDEVARMTRIDTFEKAAGNRQSTFEGYNDVSSALVDDEKIIVELECCEISGLPSNTSNTSYRGAIKLTLVESLSHKNCRVFFTVLEGSVDLSVKESFFNSDTVLECVCCFMPIPLPNVRFLRSIDMDYDTHRLLSTQFCTLPAMPCVVDAMCYRSCADEFAAHAHKDESPTGDKGCDLCNCSQCCNCVVCFHGGRCCGCYQVKKVKSIDYEARASTTIGASDTVLEPLIEQPTEIVDDLSWKVTASDLDNIYVVIHYRSLLDNGNRTCKMRLNPHTDRLRAYSDAMRFVATLGIARDTDSRDYFESHPSMSVDNIRGARIGGTAANLSETTSFVSGTGLGFGLGLGLGLGGGAGYFGGHSGRGGSDGLMHCCLKVLKSCATCNTKDPCVRFCVIGTCPCLLCCV